MKTTEQRINNIIGQLEGIKRMDLCAKHDCFSILTQLKAVKSAMTSLIEKVVAEEFECCLVGDSVKEKDKLEKIFNEIIKK